MGTVVSLNGVVVAPEEARVSVFDRGFLYGDSVYEVIRTYRGVPFELQAHLERLAGSAERIGMGLPVPLQTFAEETWEAHRASGNAESYLRIVSTRGSGKLGLDPGLAEDPVRVVIAMPLDPPPEALYTTGASIALVSVRRNLRTAIDPRAKTGNYLNSVMAVKEARQRGAYEAVMLDHRDYVTEGASSNIFAVFERAIFTPPLDAGILRGVTRAVIFEVARRAGLRLLELPLSEAALKQADEVFISSSIREIVPINRVDDVTIGEGVPGPIFRQIRRLFAEYVAEYAEAHGKTGG